MRSAWRAYSTACSVLGRVRAATPQRSSRRQLQALCRRPRRARRGQHSLPPPLVRRHSPMTTMKMRR